MQFCATAREGLGWFGTGPIWGVARRVGGLQIGNLRHSRMQFCATSEGLLRWGWDEGGDGHDVGLFDVSIGRSRRSGSRAGFEAHEFVDQIMDHLGLSFGG